jgi:hypothetical protein
MCVIIWIGLMDREMSTLCHSPEDHTPHVINYISFEFRISMLTTCLKLFFNARVG